MHFGLLWADVADEISKRLVDAKDGAFDALGDFSFDANAMGQEPAPFLFESPWVQVLGAE